jgi:hypothetical protein
MKIVAIVQARMNSTRLPNKVMKLIGGVPMSELLFARLAMAERVYQMVLGKSTGERNLPSVHTLKFRLCVLLSQLKLLRKTDYFIDKNPQRAIVSIKFHFNSE